jgi:hypothetical protein
MTGPFVVTVDQHASCQKMLNFYELIIILVVIHIVLFWVYFSTIYTLCMCSPTTLSFLPLFSPLRAKKFCCATKFIKKVPTPKKCLLLLLAHAGTSFKDDSGGLIGQ